MSELNITTITLLILLISSFTISALLQSRFKRISLNRIEFILIGVLLSHHFGIGLIDQAQITAFSPLISLIIGFFGFLIGLEIVEINFKNDSSLTGFYIGCVLFLIMGGVIFYLVMFLFPDMDGAKIARSTLHFSDGRIVLEGSYTHLWIALTLGSMVAVTSVECVKNALRKYKARGDLSSMMIALTLPGELLAILVFGTTFAAERAVQSSQTLHWTITEWTVAVIGLGIFCSVLFWLFLDRKNDPLRLYLATIGIVTFASGIAIAVGVSPLFLNFICGMMLATTSPHASSIVETLKDLRGPLAIMILFFAGVFLKPTSSFEFILPAAYITLRFLLLRLIPGYMVKSITKDSYFPNPQRLFHSQDILIVVLAMDLSIRGLAISNLILITALGAFVIFGLIGNLSIKRLLIATCEVDPARDPLLLKKG